MKAPNYRSLPLSVFFLVVLFWFFFFWEGGWGEVGGGILEIFNAFFVQSETRTIVLYGFMILDI